MKKPFVTREQLEAIAAQYPTPFHIYDETGIRENARRLKAAFAWNPGYREYFAVKATPTPAILKILKEEGCGCDLLSRGLWRWPQSPWHIVLWRLPGRYVRWRR